MTAQEYVLDKLKTFEYDPMKALIDNNLPKYIANRPQYEIYMWVNKINGKIYVGQHAGDSSNDGYTGSGVYFNRAIKKYGLENFDKHLLDVSNNWCRMDQLEEWIVDSTLIEMKDCYNLKTGGSKGKYSQETRKKISESVRKSVEDGTHNFLGENNPTHKRVADGTHNFLGQAPWINGRTKNNSLQIRMWKDMHTIYELWINSNKPKYGRLANLVNRKLGYKPRCLGLVNIFNDPEKFERIKHQWQEWSANGFD
ncbi:hypothetical protein ABXV22_07060 [Vibrio rotiferianus]|uniref:hypothetical protein n=1 Tax=Vibrio rotiferianus TaxID=190895 RepID=UPI0033933166